MKTFSKSKSRKPLRILLLGGLVLLLLAGIGTAIYLKTSTAAKKGTKVVKTSQVSKETIVSTLSSSGTIMPKNSYTITSMVSGEVISADFEEGDQVSEGQVLYQINASSAETQLNSATSSLSRSQDNYDDALKNYNKAAGNFSGNTVKSDRSGYLKSLSIKVGDKISGNSEIGTLYNDTVMTLSVPFLSTEAQQIPAGSSAVLTLSDTLEQIVGTVLSVGSLDETLTGGQLVRYVTIQVQNPGGLTTSMTATAEVNGMQSCGDASFEATQDTPLKLSALKSEVTVKSLLVHPGDYISEGQALFTISSSDASDQVDSYKDALRSAEDNLENAKSTLDKAQDSLDNYTITAPISGTVVSKSVNSGENVQTGNTATTLAVIYDLSEVTFQMNIDELDISKVKVGQEVTVTADAFENETFTGTVTNVSMEGTSSNGVTYYPVTVTLKEYGDLLPGMNVEGVITLDKAENVLAVPVDALQRGNQVYVKDTAKESSENTNKAPVSSDSTAKTGEKQSASGLIPDGFHAVTVETGVTSDEYVEITSGDLSEGDTVYITQSTVTTNEDINMPGMNGGPDGGFGGAPGGNFSGNRSGSGAPSGGPMRN